MQVDQQYITLTQLQGTYVKATEVKRLINGLITYLRKTKK
jgi:hypothetical protein